MALELPGVAAIETPEQARKLARRWRAMARELDGGDAPEQARAKARELNQRAEAAYSWARKQETALQAGHEAAAAHPESVRRIHQDRGTRPLQGGGQPHAYGPRRAAHEAYQAARPPAMRIAHRGRQHFFQGLSEPFGPVGGGFDLAMELLGLTVGIVFFSLFLRTPNAVAEGGSHVLGFIHRAVEPIDPLTGSRPPAAAKTRPAAAVGGKAATGQGG